MVFFSGNEQPADSELAGGYDETMEDVSDCKTLREPYLDNDHMQSSATAADLLHLEVGRR